ncbi:MAG TPA: secondary thiamine-phosphate synthase enzyme YjbQ [Xanthobacteraceae bacterium]|nr:secondary thiamine-phosphate synthase enzyme YjbQ [Xanthobacteraceae bacterium]
MPRRHDVSVDINVRHAGPASVSTAVFTVSTSGAGFTDITAALRITLAQIGAREGVALLFVRHTSASLTIQENADPDVLADLTTALARLAPEDAGWRHDAEGPDDMPAHVKAMLTGVSLHVAVMDGAPALGIWQGVYLVEHRARPHRREVVIQFIGERS